MIAAELAFDSWNLKELHKYLIGMRRILAGKITDEELTALTEMFKDLQDIKDKMVKDDKKQIDFYNKADEIYIHMGIKCKTHGLFFRENIDVGL